MARPTRDVRGRSLHFGNFDAGDIILLVVSVLLFIALLNNWWVDGVAVNALKFSGLYFVVTLILILFTLALVLYPLLQSESTIRPLPFSTPPIILAVGFVILLMTTYELGKYQSIVQSPVAPGFGLWLAFICSWLYLIGGLVKWGNRQRRLTASR